MLILCELQFITRETVTEHVSYFGNIKRAKTNLNAHTDSF